MSNLIIKNRVRDAKTNKIIGYERINQESGQWEHFRLKRHGYLLGCITSEDNLIREPFIGLLAQSGEEIYLNDNIKHYYDEYYGWRPGTIVWDESTLCFAWVSQVNNVLSKNGENLIKKYLSGSINIAAEKFLL